MMFGYMLKISTSSIMTNHFLLKIWMMIRKIQITLTPWILLTEDKEIVIPSNHVVTIVEPIDSVKEMYSEK